jgi:hypothetical protein
MEPSIHEIRSDGSKTPVMAMIMAPIPRFSLEEFQLSSDAGTQFTRQAKPAMKRHTVY